MATKEELNKYEEEVARTFLSDLLFLIANREDAPKELTFWKTTIQGPNGEAYLLSLQHVGGPKISLENNDEAV